MKAKMLAFLLSFLFGGLSLSAQKTALVDMEYILSRIPAYEKVSKDIEASTQRMQAEVSKLEEQAKNLYEQYQVKARSLSDSQRKTQEEAIVAKEKEAYELKKKYFSPEGTLAKEREEKMKPIRDAVWKGLKQYALSNNIQIIIDRTSSKIVYADPSVDISGNIVEVLGFSK